MSKRNAFVGFMGTIAGAALGTAGVKAAAAAIIPTAVVTTETVATAGLASGIIGGSMTILGVAIPTIAVVAAGVAAAVALGYGVWRGWKAIQAKKANKEAVKTAETKDSAERTTMVKPVEGSFFDKLGKDVKNFAKRTAYVGVPTAVATACIIGSGVATAPAASIALLTAGVLMGLVAALRIVSASAVDILQTTTVYSEVEQMVKEVADAVKTAAAEEATNAGAQQPQPSAA